MEFLIAHGSHDSANCQNLISGEQSFVTDISTDFGKSIEDELQQQSF